MPVFDADAFLDLLRFSEFFAGCNHVASLVGR